MADSSARSRTRAALALALLVSPWLRAGAVAQEDGATSASSAIYVRSDSDRTTVVTPRLHVGVPVDEDSRLDLVYTVDVWSSASIDIRTAASKRVVEQRDEIDVSGEHGIGDATIGASYRYSTEYDYESHGGSLGLGLDLAQKSASLAFTAKAYVDRVGRAGDPDFDRGTSLLSGRAGFTQLLDPDTYVELVYELTRQSGYLSSPYRFVRVAASEDQLPRTCVVPVQSCVPENNPDGRLRHAAALAARRALTASLSLGLGYRYYIDDWEMQSHTGSVDGALLIDDEWLLSLAYRIYRQSKAVHYEPFYVNGDVPRYLTSDKELSTLTSHRVDVEVARSWALDDAGSVLRTVLLASPGLYQYDDFPLLDQVTALELSLSMEVRL